MGTPQLRKKVSLMKRRANMTCSHEVVRCSRLGPTESFCLSSFQSHRTAVRFVNRFPQSVGACTSQLALRCTCYRQLVDLTELYHLRASNLSKECEVAIC